MSGWTPSQNDPGSSPSDSDASSADQEAGEASRQREQFGLPAKPTPEPAPEPGAKPVSQPFAESAPPPLAGPAPQAFTTPAPEPDFGLRPEPATYPGYIPPPGSAPQPGYETQPGYGSPAGGMYPKPPRNRARTWIGIIAGIVAIGVVIAGVSIYILKRSSQQWTLTAPSSVAGLSRDTRSIDQSAFAGEVSALRSGVTSLPNYGSLKSTVSALYALGPNQEVGFIGFNGRFNVQVVLKNGSHLKVSKANPGPHSGTAECGQLSPDTLCQWSTPTTVGVIVVIPTSAAASQESIAAANSLMLRIRGAVEHSSHRS